MFFLFKKLVFFCVTLLLIFAEAGKADESVKGLSLAHEFRANVLARIHSNLYGVRGNLMFLGAEVKQLVNIYKDYLANLEKSVSEQEKVSSLLNDVRLLLARLEKGTQNWNNDNSQMVFCYDIISTIESIFYKLETPQESFDATTLPLISIAVIDPYKKLQGEKLPYKINKKKKESDWNDLSSLPIAQLKIISSPSSTNSVEEDLNDR